MIIAQFNINEIRKVKLFRTVLNFILHKKRPALWKSGPFISI